jgi:hypothetical protein
MSSFQELNINISNGTVIVDAECDKEKWINALGEIRKILGQTTLF